MTGTTKIIWPDCLRRSGAICKTIWQPSNKLWPSEIYVWDAETNHRIPYTCQLTYRMIAYHIRKTETLQWALHKTRSWGRYSYHKLSLFNKCSPMSDDIGVCVILAKSVHSKPQVVRCTDCHRSSSIFRCTPDAPGREHESSRRASRVENTMFFFVTYGVNTQWMDILPVQTFV